MATLKGTTINGDLTMTGSIKKLAINGGLYWNEYVESSTDGTDAASITVIQNGNGNGGTVLQIKQANDSNDVINLVAGDILANGTHITRSGDNVSSLTNDSGYITNGQDYNFINYGNEFTFAPSGYSGGIYFNYRTQGGTNGNITEYYLGNGKGGSLGTIIHTGNIDSYALKLSGGTNSVSFNSNNLPQFSGTPSYLVGIESFASGGTLKWQSASSVNVGFATSAGRVRTQSHTDWWLDMQWNDTYFITRAKSDGGSYLPIWVNNAGYADSAGSAAPAFANSTWYIVGDDAYIGDHDQAGAFCVKGANGSPRIMLYNSDNSYNSTVWTTASLQINYSSGTLTIKT